MKLGNTRLGSILVTLTDYHANGSYEKLKEHVELLNSENYAIMVRTTNFSQNNFKNNLKYISKEAYAFLEKSKVDAGNIIMNKIADAGACYYMPVLGKPVSLGMNLFLLRTDKMKVDSFYVFSYLKFHEHYVKSFASGSTTKTITKEDVRNLKILLLPLPEQRKIAKILTTWDKAIATTEKLISTSKQQKKNLMQQLLTGKKRLLNPETGIPFSGEWEEVNLTKVCKRLMEKNNGQSTNVVTISSRQGLIRQEEFFKKSVASETLDNYFILRSGQFAYNKSYSNGYPMGAIKRLNRYQDAVVTSLYICFEIENENVTSTNFMEQYFESGLLNRGLRRVAAEGGRAHGLLNVKPSDFMSLELSLPMFIEQQKIAQVLTTADKEIETLETKLARLQQEKKALMQQLLTGKRRVKVDEVVQ